jgi:hypothetical protein
MAGTLLHTRCNPYGHEDGGPRHLLGGLYGPEYEGKNKWHCPNLADRRARMECKCGHRGQPMDLCQDHHGEIQRRQAGCCPPCAWPPAAIDLKERIDYANQQLAMMGPLVFTPRGARLRREAEDATAAMNELVDLGLIHRCPLTLTEIS